MHIKLIYLNLECIGIFVLKDKVLPNWNESNGHNKRIRVKRRIKTQFFLDQSVWQNSKPHIWKWLKLFKIAIIFFR